MSDKHDKPFPFPFAFAFLALAGPALAGDFLGRLVALFARGMLHGLRIQKARQNKMAERHQLHCPTDQQGQNPCISSSWA